MDKRICSLFAFFIFVAAGMPVAHTQSKGSWSLQYVYIQLTNGQRLHGYLRLNENDLKSRASGIKNIPLLSFRDSLLAGYREWSSLEVYTDLIADKTILDGVILSKKKPEMLSMDKIAAIRRTNGQYNGTSASWRAINVVTEKEWELLAQKPYYFYIYEGNHVYLTLLSYHQAFKTSNLQKIGEQIAGLAVPEFEAAREDYRSKNIIILRFD